MSKEQGYLHDSGATPTPLTPAEQAFFRYQFVLGSYEYLRQHGSSDDARALNRELDARYGEYRRLRDASHDGHVPGDPAWPPAPPGILRESPPLRPGELPPELAERLRAEGPYAAMLWGTDHGSAYVLKLPGHDLDRLPKRVPVQVQHELWNPPTAPVIRTVLQIHDQPQSSIVLEVFTNPAEQDQRAEFVGLSTHMQTLLMLYDEQAQHRRTIVIAPTEPATVALILTQAEAALGGRTPTHDEFMTAKQAVTERTSL
jgi:hypothetical protein